MVGILFPGQLYPGEWYLLVGFYPACPATDNYGLGILLFKKINIQLNKDYYPGNQIIIEKNLYNLIKFILMEKKYKIII